MDIRSKSLLGGRKALEVRIANGSARMFRNCGAASRWTRHRAAPAPEAGATGIHTEPQPFGYDSAKRRNHPLYDGTRDDSEV